MAWQRPCGCRARALLPLALALVLATATRAALAQVTVTTAIYTGASQITVTLSNTTASSADCRNAFALYNADNTTKGGASPFANCTASGTSALLFLSNGVTYAGGEHCEHGRGTERQGGHSMFEH